MMILGNVPIILVFLALLLCSGCAGNLFSFKDAGKGTPVSAGAAASSPPHRSIPSSAVPVAEDADRRHFIAVSGADFAYAGAVLTEDVTWRGQVSISGVLTIAPQATVSVEPGTVVTFFPGSAGRGDGALLVQGRIFARGTAENPVMFRPGTREAAAGDWQGILLVGSGKSNLFEECRIQGASTGLDAIFSTITLKGVQFTSCGTGARAQGSLFRSTGGGASGCDRGYALLDGESDVRGAALSENRTGLYLSGGALTMEGAGLVANSVAGLVSTGGKLALDRCSVKGNGSGITLSSTDGTISGNRIEGNREFGVRLNHSMMRVWGNVISRNVGMGLMVDDGGSAAWRNDISSNGLFDIYNDGEEDFRAPANWWGFPSVDRVNDRVFDRADDSRKGAVLANPVLTTAPELAP